MGDPPPKLAKRDLPPLHLPLQPTSTTGASDSKIDHSSIAGFVSGNFRSDNSKTFIYIRNAIFTDREAALSRLVEGGTSFVEELIVKPKLPPTELDHLQPTYSSDSSDDCDQDTISDEELHDMILSEQNNGENDSDINEISDDFVYSMVIRHICRSYNRELNIQLRNRRMNMSPSPSPSPSLSPKEAGVEEKGNDILETEDVVTASTDQCDLKYPVKTDDHQRDVKLKSVLRMGKPCYQMFEIDLSDIVDRKIRIVTTENVNKTVEIARYKPNATGKVTSFLDRIFEETHNSENRCSFSTGVTSTNMVKNIKTLKGVCKIDKRYVDDMSFVTIDLSHIITHYDGYVFLKTKNNVEIIVNIAENDPNRTTEIAHFLTETFLV